MKQDQRNTIQYSLMKLISIKAVVAVLVIITSLVGVLFALIPPLVQLRSNAMSFVVGTATSISDKLQFSLAVELRTAKNAGDTLYKAAKQHDLLTPGVGRVNSSTLFSWAGSVVLSESLTVILAQPSDNVMVVVSPYNTLFSGNLSSAFVSDIAGFVFLYRTASVGKFFEYGYFRPNAPYLPYNTTHPWSAYPSPLTWADQPISIKLSDPNRTSSMQWTSLSTRNTSRPTSALLSYGGSLSVSTASDPPSQRQTLSVNVRGETLSTHFSNMTCLKVRGAVALLIDTVSGSFIAGSISDPTSTYVAGHPVLMNVTALRDPRIFPILHASAGTMSGAHVHRPVPLWPHLDELHSGQAVVPMGVIGFRFTTVYVSQVDYNTWSFVRSAADCSAAIQQHYRRIHRRCAVKLVRSCGYHRLRHRRGGHHRFSIVPRINEGGATYSQTCVSTPSGAAFESTLLLL